MSKFLIETISASAMIMIRLCQVSELFVSVGDETDQETDKEGNPIRLILEMGVKGNDNIYDKGESAETDASVRFSFTVGKSASADV